MKLTDVLLSLLEYVFIIFRREFMSIYFLSETICIVLQIVDLQLFKYCMQHFLPYGLNPPFSCKKERKDLGVRRGYDRLAGCRKFRKISIENSGNTRLPNL